MKNPDTTYTNPQEHLSQDQLMRYRQEKMDDAEMHRVERHLLECELCSDAVEGMELLEPPQAAQALDDLKGRLSARLGEQKNPARPLYWKWGVAASVLLIAGAVFFGLNKSSLTEEEQSVREIVQQEEVEKSKGAPVLSSNEEEENKTSDQAEMPANAPAQPIATELDLGEREQISPARKEKQQAPMEIEDFVFEETESIVIAKEGRDSIIKPAMRDDNPDLLEISGTNGTNRDQNNGYVANSILSRRIAGTSQPPAGYKELRGKITDSSGEPLPGATVSLPDYNKGTTTDLEGEYSLQLPAKRAAIEVSYIGFETKKVMVPDTARQLAIVLDEDIKSLSEVAVVGYGTQRRRDVTGAVSAVSIEEISPTKPVDGMRSFRRYIRQNRLYTSQAREAGIEGAVVVDFYVEPDSTLSNFQIRKSLGYGLDEEAIRLLKEGPKWKPATSGTKTIRHKASVKIPFKLD